MKCDNCKIVAKLEAKIEVLTRHLDATEAAHDATLARTIKRDTDVINGLLREIEALYLLLEKRNNSNGESSDSRKQIRNCQNMNL